ncbi:hypothetical protein GCM10023166_05800 [Paeniglutamicibacter cryotolerans]
MLASASILLVSWEMGLGQLAAEHAAATAPAERVAVASTRPGAGPSTTSPTPAKAKAPASGSYAGLTESTQYGNVQVRITVVAGKVTDVAALQLTDRDTRSVSISNQAAPILRQEILRAQKASVQTVSGATYTSDAYLSSLQSALDQAGL